MTTKTKIKLLFGILITLLIIYYSFKTLSHFDLKTALHANINWFLVFVSVIITLYSNYVRGLSYTLGIDPNINRLTALQVVVIGHAANMILPLHIGDGLRFAFFPSNYSALQRTKLVMVPAIADSVAIIVLSMLAVPFSGFTDPRIVSVLWILFFSCVALSLLLVACVLFIPRIRNYVRGYLTIGLLNMMLWVLLSYVLLLLATWLGLAACGFGFAASLPLSLAVFAVTNLISFIPSSPGAIGLFEYGVIVGLAGLGIHQGEALLASLVLHLILYAALLPQGLVLYLIALHGKYGEAVKKILHH